MYLKVETPEEAVYVAGRLAEFFNRVERSWSHEKPFDCYCSHCNALTAVDAMLPLVKKFAGDAAYREEARAAALESEEVQL